MRRGKNSRSHEVLPGAELLAKLRTRYREWIRVLIDPPLLPKLNYLRTYSSQDSKLKIYRSTEELLAETERLLAAKHSPALHSPLEEVIDLLVRGRHYTWMGIYLAAGRSNQQLLGAGGEPHPAQMASPETKSKILVSMKLAGHELGVLDAESDRENAFGPRDRVLVEKAAHLVALFLTGPGRHIVRKARAQAMAQS